VKPTSHQSDKIALSVYSKTSIIYIVVDD